MPKKKWKMKVQQHLKVKEKVKNMMKVKKEDKKSKPKEPKCVGQSFVVSSQGYYCKLCHKFLNDVTVAKSKHYRSIMHTDAYKRAMEEPSEQDKKKSNRKPGNWLTVCECAFTGNFLVHCRTKEHRKNRHKKYHKKRHKKCPLRMRFSNSEEYRYHCRNEEHKQRSAEFHYLKNLASGSNEDEAKECKEPEEVRRNAIDKIEERQKKMKTYYDKKKCKAINYDKGEIVVMRKTPQATGQPLKTQPKYRGPLIITGVLPGDTYRVTQLEEKKKGHFFATTAHVSQLKPWRMYPDSSDSSESEV